MNSDDAANRTLIYLKILAGIFVPCWCRSFIDLLPSYFAVNDLVTKYVPESNGNVNGFLNLSCYSVCRIEID